MSESKDVRRLRRAVVLLGQRQTSSRVPVVATCIQALLQQTISPDALAAQTIRMECGQEHELVEDGPCGFAAGHQQVGVRELL